PSLLRINWTQDEAGVWHIEEASEGVVHSVNFAGGEDSVKWGLHHESTTRQEAPQEPVPGTKTPPDHASPQNPFIVERTWAQKIESYTGSEKCRIPLIKEETWAEETTSLTDVTNATETTNVSGTSTSTTTIGTSNETTKIDTSTSTTTIGTSSE